MLMLALYLWAGGAFVIMSGLDMSAVAEFASHGGYERETGERRPGAERQRAGRLCGQRARLGPHAARLQSRPVVRERQRRLVLPPDPGRRPRDAGELRIRSEAAVRRLRRDRD